jgi:hypothetical protein
METRITLTNVRDGNPQDLMSFFGEFGDVQLERLAIAAKGEFDLIQILITIAGTWAAERYILDPLADRLDSWKKAVTSLVGKQFEITVHFRNGQVTSIETIAISNPFILGKMLQILKSVSDLLANKSAEVALDKVLIVPNGSNDPLIIGHQGNRPTHIIDLISKTIMPIKDREEEDPEVAFWEIEQLGSEIEYLQKLSGDHSGEIKALEDEIMEKVAIWLQ